MERFPFFIPVKAGCRPLDIDAVRALLAGTDAGGDIRYLPHTTSTNAVAAALERDKWSTGTAILTDFQSAGRGRRGRSWTAPPRTAVLASVLLAPAAGSYPVDPVFAAALAAADAIESAGVPTRLKWPNDVLVPTGKVAGILAERLSGDAGDRVVVGIGINVNLAAADLPAPGASSLLLELGRALSRERIAAALLLSLHRRNQQLERDAEPLYLQWRSRLDTVGSQVQVVSGDRAWSGRATDVARDGALLVVEPDGLVHRVYAGDVSLR